jgi:hypothetical protein
MNLIELLWFLFIVGGGACAGFKVAALFSSNPSVRIVSGIIGALVSLGTFFLLFYFSDRESQKQPPCRSGKSSREDFKYEKDADWGYIVDKCQCGLRYFKRAGWLWYEILPDGNARLYMQRDFWGNWKPATERNKARKALKRPSV